MISLIICSRRNDISEELKHNINSTIGTEYELVVIDNSQNKYSIFSAYNEGVRRSKYPYLCFMHDDILYHTEGWGRNIMRHFAINEVGAICVAGGHFLPDTPSGWNTTRISSFNLIQRIYNGDKYKLELWDQKNYMKNPLIAEAVVMDGVWFCIRKSLFLSISFDEITFKGFHCYDMDVSLQIRNSGFSIFIVTDILIEHFSIGSSSIDWINDTIRLYNKWKHSLPQIAGVSLSDNEIIERTELATIIFDLKKEVMRIRNTKAFRVGTFILKPLSFLKKFIK